MRLVWQTKCPTNRAKKVVRHEAVSSTEARRRIEFPDSEVREEGEEAWNVNATLNSIAVATYYC